MFPEVAASLPVSVQVTHNLERREHPLQQAFFQDEFDTEPLWPLYFHRWGDFSASARMLVPVCVAVGFGLLCAAGRLLAQNTHHTAIFWGANGVLAAFLCGERKSRWWAYLVAAWLSDSVASLWLGAPLSLAAPLAFCNVAEALIAAVLLRRVLVTETDLASPKTMAKFLLFAVGCAPATAGLLAAAWYRLTLGVPFWHLFGKWLPSHALGIAVMMPLVLAWSNPEFRKIFDGDRFFQSMGVLIAILFASVAVFEQTHYSLRFLCLPLLMLVVFEVGILGGLTAVFEISIVGAFYTLRGDGPLWMEKGATMQGSVLVLQCALLAILASVIPFAAMLERQREMHKRLHNGMKRYRLLADNSRDIVVLSNLEGRRLYVSPAVHDVLGWTREEWTGRDAGELMHPDDVSGFRRMLQELVHGEDRRTFRYRTQHKDGRYVWMEANVRILLDEISGKANAFVANVRDISLRVDAEEKLAEAHLQVQQQAQRDSLTELANRRRFDDALEQEWRRGRRTGSPLALLMVDIDNFKHINDTCGHRTGDSCLQALAGILRQVARRPGDIAARYGGDEFAVLLPDVDPASASTLADGICLKARQQLLEVGIGRGLALTVSVGVAARIPDKNVRADSLVEAADRALYEAKMKGRDRAAANPEAAPSAAIALYPVQ